MKFTKYNNPNRKKSNRRPKHSAAYIEERRNEMFDLLAKAKTESEKDSIIKAYHVSIAE